MKQLLRLRPAFEGCAVTHATVQPSYAAQVPGERFHLTIDATMSRWDLVKMVLEVLIVIRTRPDDRTTGAAPGCRHFAWGKLLGARTVWVR